MITTLDLPETEIKKVPPFEGQKAMSNIVGIDSETFPDGHPFMLCTSFGDTLTPADFPHVLFSDRYLLSNFVCWNLKFDSGAILMACGLTHEALDVLRRMGEVRFNGLTYHYIAHKHLKIESGNQEWVKFWDVAQYYHSSLDAAAEKYMGENKMDIETKTFTPEYVNKKWDTIAKYCIKDAILTKKLTDRIIEKLTEFEISTPSLYSCASITAQYFSQNTSIPDTFQLWNGYPDVMAMACDAYAGGKFEITARGSFDMAYEYDLASAYPYEMSNLKDVSEVRVVRDTSYFHSDADFGFCRVRIECDGDHLPCGLMDGAQRYYPKGTFYTTITMNEVAYIATLPNTNIDIISGVYLYCETNHYPFRQIIKKLYEFKDIYKRGDQTLYLLVKILMNSYYGKGCQVIPDLNLKKYEEYSLQSTDFLKVFEWLNFKNPKPGKNFKPGQHFNPIYASVITANTRIKIATMQNLLKDSCLAVHTDSVITTKPIPDKLLSPGLGGWAFEVDGSGLIVACGQYQIGSISKFKGVVPRKRESWTSLLSKAGSRSKISYPQTLVESWIEATGKNHRDQINVFRPDKKVIDLNVDTKRVWSEPTNAKLLLNHLQYSEAHTIFEEAEPFWWSKRVRSFYRNRKKTKLGFSLK